MQTTDINVVKQNYEIMAESNRGPLIAMHSNSVCCQFTIDRKYRETVTILKNFVTQKVEEITYGSKRMACSLQEAVDQRRQTKHISNDERVTESMDHNLIKLLTRENRSFLQMSRTNKEFGKKNLSVGELDPSYRAGEQLSNGFDIPRNSERVPGRELFMSAATRQPISQAVSLQATMREAGSNERDAVSAEGGGAPVVVEEIADDPANDYGGRKMDMSRTVVGGMKGIRLQSALTKKSIGSFVGQYASQRSMPRQGRDKQQSASYRRLNQQNANSTASIPKFSLRTEPKSNASTYYSLNNAVRQAAINVQEEDAQAYASNSKMNSKNRSRQDPQRRLLVVPNGASEANATTNYCSSYSKAKAAPGGSFAEIPSVNPLIEANGIEDEKASRKYLREKLRA